MQVIKAVPLLRLSFMRFFALPENHLTQLLGRLWNHALAMTSVQFGCIQMERRPIPPVQ